jgi:hypothetical protein|tara:strand:+ start:368 stop:811 length:444 start_codon:yes stop_codon:yes gene_type:complete
MPIFIAHRGNINGVNPEEENTLSYLRRAHEFGYGVECDLQVHNDVLYFGHDEPQEPVDYHFISQPNVFCHAKSVDTMIVLLNSGVHCFYHQKDDMTLTSFGYMWCYPGFHPKDKRAIWLDLGNIPIPSIDKKIYGICGDNINVFKNA